MILAIDIGNSNIVVGGIDEKETFFIERLSTDATKTELEYAIMLKNILDIYHIDRSGIEGGIVSSVVPVLTIALKRAAEKILHKSPLVLSYGIRTDLDIALDNPSEMGADRIADAVAAIHEYPVPAVIIDMGTATTISVIDADKKFIGGMICPGVRISLDALTSRAAKLSGISIEAPKQLIGRNTIDCMKSGIIFGTASMIDGIIDRISEALGTTPTVIATGGMSGSIVPHCRSRIQRDENLLLKGLLIIYRKNSTESN